MRSRSHQEVKEAPGGLEDPGGTRESRRHQEVQEDPGDP